MAFDSIKPAVRKLLATPKKTKQDGKLWSLIAEKRTLGLDIRRPFEWQWIINLAFLFGKQYTVLNARSGKLVEVTKNPHERKAQDNQIIKYWRRQVTDFVKSRPEVAAVPASNSDEDRDAAKIATKVAKAFWINRRMRKKLREAGLWLYSTGNVFLEDVWNKRLAPIGFSQEQGRFVYAGDADVNVWSPFDVLGPFAHFNGGDLDDYPWLILEKTRTLEYLADKYKEGHRVTAEDFAGMNILTVVSNALGKSDISRVPSAMEVWLRIKPCKKYPKGLSVFAANGVILEEGDYPFDTYSLEQFKDLEAPGIFWGKATTEFAIPLQRSWNEDASSIENFNRWMGKGKWLSPRNANMESDPDDTHGEVIQYTPVVGHKPEHVTLKGLPSTYDQNMGRIKLSLQDLFSQHEVSMGTNKSDIRSGEMVDLLLEQDAHGGVLSRATFEEGLEHLLTRVMKRIAKGYKSERVMHIASSENRYEVLSFQGADLGNNTTIRVLAQSTVPESRIAREAKIERRFRQGVYGNPQDPKVRRHVMKMLDEAVTEDIFSDEYLDEQLADFENDNLAHGIRVIANSYDNHVIHLEVHARFLKSLKYQRAKLENPKLAALDAFFGEHLNQHQEAVNQLMRQQMAMQGGANEPTRSKPA